MLPIRCLTPATPSTSAPATPSGVTLATSSSCCNDANHSQPSDTQALKLTGNATVHNHEFMLARPELAQQCLQTTDMQAKGLPSCSE